MKIKAIIYILVSCFIISIASSCESLINTNNPGTVDPDEHYQTAQDVNAALLGLYAQMQELAPRLVVVNELRAGNLELVQASEDLNQLVNNNISSTNYYSNKAPFYAIINSCNDILFNIGKVSTLDPSFTPDIQAHYAAEAAGVRNFIYFLMAKTFGQIEYFENPITEAEKPNQVTNYEFEEALDLLIAKQQALMTSYDLGIEQEVSSAWQRLRFGLYAAHTMLADMHLFRASITSNLLDYNEVIANLSVVMNINSTSSSVQTFKLGSSYEKSNWSKIFDEIATATDEVIFGVTYNKVYQQEHSLQKIFNTNQMLSVSDKMLTSWESNDARKSISVNSSSQVAKFAVNKDEFDNDAPVILYRAGEVFLMYAEALAYVGKPSEALTIINSGNSYVEYTPTGTIRYNAASKGIRGRMGLGATPSVTDDIAIAVSAIRKERVRELAFEGKSWTDKIRYAYKDGSADIVAGDVRVPKTDWFIK